MGLNCSHDAWDGAYSSFQTFRLAVGKAAGYTIVDEGRNSEYVNLDWNNLTESNVYGEWEKMPDDPLIIFLAHSDCEGEIKPEHAVAVAEALEKVVPKLTGWNKARAEQFAAGLRAAAAANEPLEFM